MFTFHRPLLALIATSFGCGPVTFPASELSSGATFAAHQVHNGFRIDRLQGGGTGVVESARWINGPGSPQFRVRAEEVTLGDLWLITPAHVEVRESGAPRTVGDIEPAWDDGAIRLSIPRAVRRSGRVFSTGSAAAGTVC